MEIYMFKDSISFRRNKLRKPAVRGRVMGEGAWEGGERRVRMCRYVPDTSRPREGKVKYFFFSPFLSFFFFLTELNIHIRIKRHQHALILLPPLQLDHHCLAVQALQERFGVGHANLFILFARGGEDGSYRGV